MAATADEAFWAFVMYVKNNLHKSIDNMTENDFDAMVSAFAAVNVTTGITAATAPDLANYYGYGEINFINSGGNTLDFPAKGTTLVWAADGLGITCSTTYALNMVAVKQAAYPEDHRGA